ncbi:hypothetical protein C8R43DRAFT_963531 [Mycena crocata]|nr:hypothetical protein C8R43DRAFT_963531 [Mycena crocata]
MTQILAGRRRQQASESAMTLPLTVSGVDAAPRIVVVLLLLIGPDWARIHALPYWQEVSTRQKIILQQAEVRDVPQQWAFSPSFAAGYSEGSVLRIKDVPRGLHWAFRQNRHGGMSQLFDNRKSVWRSNSGVLKASEE